MSRMLEPWTAMTMTVLLALLALLVAALCACNTNIEDVLDLDEEPSHAKAYTGPRKRAAHRATVHCFESYSKFKRAMGKRGLRSRTGESQWHHIVGQHSDNKKKFGEYDLHCTDNIVLLRLEMHQKLNGYYNRSRRDLGRKSLRDWLKPMSFDEQYIHGLKALEEVGKQVGATWDWIE